MLHNGLGSNTFHSLSQAWSSESRGPRLSASDFEAKTRILGQHPVEAIVVLPVAAQIGKGAIGIIAQYPLYAAVALDRDSLNQLTASGATPQRHDTLSAATRNAAALNRDSETQYLNDYQAGHLASVESWHRSESSTPIEKDAIILPTRTNPVPAI